MIEHFRYKVYKKNGNNWNLVGSTTGTTLSVSDGVYVVEYMLKQKECRNIITSDSRRNVK